MKWFECVEKAIAQITFTPYAMDGSEGVSEDIMWQGERILKAGSPATSMCTGAVMEVLCRALKLAGKEQSIGFEAMKAIKKHAFIYDLDLHYEGIAGALVEAGIADWVDDPFDAQPGDFAQYWHVDAGDNFESGHSMVILGRTTDEGHESLRIWHASTSKPNPGHKRGVKWIENKLSSGHERTWWIARIKESWLQG